MQSARAKLKTQGMGNTFYSSLYSAGIRRNPEIPAESDGIRRNGQESTGIHRNGQESTGISTGIDRN